MHKYGFVNKLKVVCKHKELKFSQFVNENLICTIELIWLNAKLRSHKLSKISARDVSKIYNISVCKRFYNIWGYRFIIIFPPKINLFKITLLLHFLNMPDVIFSELWKKYESFIIHMKAEILLTPVEAIKHGYF